MSKRLELTGKRFGNLTVVEYAGMNLNGNSMWKCKCDCGNDATVYGSNLVRGMTKSCGCGRGKKGTPKGGAVSPTYGEGVHNLERIPFLRIAEPPCTVRCPHYSHSEENHNGEFVICCEFGATVCKNRDVFVENFRTNCGQQYPDCKLFEDHYKAQHEKCFAEQKQGNVVKCRILDVKRCTGHKNCHFYKTVAQCKTEEERTRERIRGLSEPKRKKIAEEYGVK